MPAPKYDGKSCKTLGSYTLAALNEAQANINRTCSTVGIGWDTINHETRTEMVKLTADIDKSITSGAHPVDILGLIARYETTSIELIQAQAEAAKQAKDANTLSDLREIAASAQRRFGT